VFDSTCTFSKQAAKLGMIIQLYMQQGLTSLVENISSQEFDSDTCVNKTIFIFAMSTKCLGQIRRAGAFHNIPRCTVATPDTSLYGFQDSKFFANLHVPLSWHRTPVHTVSPQPLKVYILSLALSFCQDARTVIVDRVLDNMRHKLTILEI